MRWWALWLALVLCAPALVQAHEENKLADDILADRIRIVKSKRIMTLYAHDKVLKTYRVSLGKRPLGPKRKEGDYKTPEGFYSITGRKTNSEYHLALQISYPDELDRERARKKGVNPGGKIMIHGQPDDYGKHRRRRDWTHGCIAVTNEEIEEIWRLVPDGASVEILP